jgi:hypothetical protein
MRARRAVVALVAVVLAAAPPAARAATAPPRISLDRGSVAVRLGTTFAFSSTLSAGAAATGPLVAHLNVVSLDPATYVDPEDWSTHRTRYLGTVAAGDSASVRWSVKAVSSGPIAIYVTAVPADGSGPISVGPPLHVQVAERRTLNSGGVVPLAVAVPAVLVLVAVVTRRRAAPAG